MGISLLNKAIFLYDRSGLMAQPWLDAGYECWCFDGQHQPGVKRDGNLVKVGIWFYPVGIEYQSAIIRDLVGDGVKLVFGFPECTDLTVAGAKHWQAKREMNPKFQEEAKALCDLVRYVGESVDSPWAFENPVGALSTIYRKPDFTFHPCDYAGYLPEEDAHPIYPEIYPSRDRYNKNTCIWHGNGFVEPEKRKIEPLFKDNPGWKKCGGKSVRTKNIRSATPRGFAKAVFEFNQ
ncbi:Dcm methylase [Vibrio cholerae]|uniref:Dcm methylase n=1 Tax=Vibrio cholerae TaxID=666 RepID=UPI000E0B444E|nr:Dcm methylase [Vibrio cholerae]